MDPEDELALFLCRLFRHGVYVLPCGGGVISEPEQAIDCMMGWYNRDDLKRLCLEIVHRKAAPGGFNLPEEISNTVAGILHHLPDENLGDPWNRRLECAVGLILAATCFPIFLYFWWREKLDERQWLKRYRSQWMAAPTKSN